MNKLFRKFFGITNYGTENEPAGVVGTDLASAHDLASTPIQAGASPAPTGTGHPIRLWNEEQENELFLGGHAADLYRSRLDYDRQKVLAECLRAWRVNPLARRIVSLQTDFIIGEGLGIKCAHAATQKFLLEWWRHPLNQFDEQIPEWCDELSRSGNLFFLITANPMDGMTYVRPLPAEGVREILCKDNDVRQEILYLPEETCLGGWAAYDHSNEQPCFILHFTVNRPAGSAWGEPMLAPLLDVLGRYQSWLEDRARLNKFRTAFMYVVQGNFTNETERLARANYLLKHPPKSGEVLVLSATEQWSVLSPQLDSADASLDGLSMKKTIAAGAGIPLHYLAEPESSTRTTAEAAGTPAFRALERTQKQFLCMLKGMAVIAVAYRKRFERRLNPRAEIQLISPDITERDNSLLSLAVARIHPPLMELYDRDLMDSAEVLRLIHRMAGESFDETKPAPLGKKRPLTARRPERYTQSELPLPSDRPADQTEGGLDPYAREAGGG